VIPIRGPLFTSAFTAARIPFTCDP